MNCRQCGCRIPDRLLRQDAFRCPQCGKPYRKRPQAAQPVKTNTPRTKRPLEKKRLLIFGGGVLIFLTILIVVIVLVNNAAERRSIEEANARIKAKVETITPFMDSVHEKEQETESWSEKFNRTEQSVASYLESVIPYDLALEVLMDYRTENVYDADVSPILNPPTAVEMKKAMHTIEAFVNAAPYRISLTLNFMKNENAGICVTYLGDDITSYRIVMDGQIRDYENIDDIPDNLF